MQSRRYSLTGSSSCASGTSSRTSLPTTRRMSVLKRSNASSQLGGKLRMRRRWRGSRRCVRSSCLTMAKARRSLRVPTSSVDGITKGRCSAATQSIKTDTSVGLPPLRRRRRTVRSNQPSTVLQATSSMLSYEFLNTSELARERSFIRKLETC